MPEILAYALTVGAFVAQLLIVAQVTDRLAATTRVGIWFPFSWVLAFGLLLWACRFISGPIFSDQFLLSLGALKVSLFTSLARFIRQRELLRNRSESL